MRKLLYYIIWALFPALLSAQDWAYLSKITTHNGLVSNEVTSMLQDSKGFIWIGTDDGLHKFDGYDITVYKHNSTQKNSLAGNSIRCLFEDSQHNLWIGLKGEGLSKLNLRTGIFTTYKHQKGSNSLSYNDVAGIVEDEAGMIWIAVDRGGLDMLNPKTGVFTHYDIREKSTSKPLNNALTGMVATMARSYSVRGVVGCIALTARKNNLNYTLIGIQTTLMRRYASTFSTSTKTQKALFGYHRLTVVCIA